MLVSATYVAALPCGVGYRMCCAFFCLWPMLIVLSSSLGDGRVGVSFLNGFVQTIKRQNDTLTEDSPSICGVLSMRDEGQI